MEYVSDKYLEQIIMAAERNEFGADATIKFIRDLAEEYEDRLALHQDNVEILEKWKDKLFESLMVVDEVVIRLDIYECLIQLEKAIAELKREGGFNYIVKVSKDVGIIREEVERTEEEYTAVKYWGIIEDWVVEDDTFGFLVKIIK